MATEIDCSSKNLSHKKRSICHAITSERVSLILDNDRQRIPYPYPSGTSNTQRSYYLDQSQWNLHPNWPKQTILLTAHRHFRGISQDMVCGIHDLFENYLEVKRKGQDEKNEGNIQPPVRSLKLKIQQILQSYQNDLISHARYEESELFPWMERKVWNEEEVNTLASQHLLLDQKLETLSELLNTLFTDSDVSQDDLRLVLLTAIEADEILLHHLAYEEDLLIPYMLTRSQEEFHDMMTELKVN